MASRMKKMFHRKDKDPEEPTQTTRAPATASSDAAIRTSLYESTTAGGLPQTGDYPIKGNDSSVILQAGRKSSVRSMRSRRSSSRGSQYNTAYQAPQFDATRSPRMSPPPSNVHGSGSYDTYDPYQDTSSPIAGQDDRQKRSSRSPLPQEFAGLNLGNGQSPATITSTVTTTRFGQQGHNTSLNTSQPQGNPGRNNDTGYGVTSRNIEPQSPYANRGMTQTQTNAGKMSITGNGTSHDNPSKRPNAKQSIFQDSGLTDRSKASGFGPADQETRPPNSYANRLTPQDQGSAGQPRDGGFGPANLEVQSPYTYADKRSAQTQGYGAQGEINARAANRGEYRQFAESNPQRSETLGNVTSDGQQMLNGQGAYQDLAREKSIPRKQVGNSAPTPYSSVQSSKASNPQIGHGPRQSDSKPLPSAPTLSDTGYGAQESTATPPSPSVLDSSRPLTKGYAAPRDGHEVVDRAKSNTYDTEVIEKIAPAVVHENVIKDVHHVREEVITREVHTHDVFHRILPIIDVEVLPPRHFLPVEGGGLVEVSAAEVPGRGQNWVIAETASKIPSDQPAPQGRRGFTARRFLGKEGDSVKDMTREGHERTEETWVHPPELEQGARLTGQSWPMVFGDDSVQKASYAGSTPNQMNRKSPRKGQAVPASPAQGAGRFGRTL